MTYNSSYKPAKSFIKQDARKHYWAVATGLQDVDRLHVSDYLREISNRYIQGSCSLDDTRSLLNDYHKDARYDSTKEADLVSQRIAELLERGAFVPEAPFFSEIHRYLFQDLSKDVYHPGEFKTERLVKQEEILNGDSVLYADPITYEMSLNAVFRDFQSNVYTTFDESEMKDFCHKIAFLWQVHPFWEGNTRCVAVFSELYLNSLGFDVENEPFEKHSKYYRNALVRAMYRNATAKIVPRDLFLLKFYENLIGNANHELESEEMVCKELFNHPEMLRNIDPSEAFEK